MDERLERAALCIADVNATAKGLAASLDCMEELCTDVRCCALRACIDQIVRKSEYAANAIDVLALS